MTSKRTFIAFPLPETVTARMKRIQKMLDPVSDGVKWVRPELMHITIKFLGDTPDYMLENIRKEFLNICTESRSFEAQFKKLGQFPREGDPRVLMAEIQGLPGHVFRLSDELNTTFVSLGFDDSGKRFSPHITIGRIKHKPHVDLIRQYYEIELPPEKFEIDRIIWYESCYKDGKLTYLPLEEILLN
ncbi:MAG: RNA 2',3'-cyclic phosphodiesterase [FCB group bacterium]|nr:RNA 2',3'-cyclic phosphodiesterase [FCB group bacterium]